MEERKMKKEKKYILEMNERQARLLSWALDTFPRLIQGQSFAYQDLFETAWEKRCKEATGNMMDEEFEGGWWEMREDAEALCKEIKRRFWKLPYISENGIHYDDTTDILWDMHQVIRHELWKNDPEHAYYTVDASQAMQVGSEPLVKIRVEDDNV